jgi:hypothetical protein
MHRAALRLFLGLSLSLYLAAFASLARAAVYKCEAGGRTTYTDKPCASGAEPAALPALQAIPATEGSALAKDFDERVAREKKTRDEADAAFLKQHAKKTAREKAIRKAIIDREVLKGMTPSEVQSAIGHADEVLPDGSWRYRRDGGRVVVRFKAGAVSSVSKSR